MSSNAGGTASQNSSIPTPTKRRATWLYVLLGLILIGAGGYFGVPRLLPQAPAPQNIQTVVAKRDRLTSTISGTGTVIPVTTAKLSFKSAGRLAEMNVRLGDTVKKGQVLARLDTTELALQVTQSKAALSTAEAKLATIKVGSRTEEVKAAQVQLDAAKAKLDAMLAGGRPEDIASAQASLDSAKVKLAQVSAGPTEAQVRSAEQAVVAAEAAVQKSANDLAKLKTGATAEEIRAAELDLERAKTSLWSSQITRDGQCGGRAQQYQCDAANASVAAAETSVAIAKNNLDKLLLPAKADDITAAEKNLASAKSQVVSAQAQLAQVRAGSTPEEIATARAAVTQAEQSLQLKQKPYTEADIQAQRQAIASAEAALALKRTPYTEADTLTAQAGIDQAKAALELAMLNLANAELVAPFDGVVSTVSGNPGEFASGSASSPVVSMVNTSELRLDVTVDEADVAKVLAGQNATVTLDAVGPQPLSGKVIAVAPSAVIQSGVATYTVSISLPPGSPAKSGMTGNASIVFAERQNALVVPNRAVRTQGRNRVVEVQAGDKTETRTVRVGLSNDQSTEILEGVGEGETVVIRATAATTPRGMPGVGPVMAPPPGK